MAGFVGMNLNPYQYQNTPINPYGGANAGIGGNYFSPVLGASTTSQQQTQPNPWADVKVVDKTSSTGGGGGQSTVPNPVASNPNPAPNPVQIQKDPYADVYASLDSMIGNLGGQQAQLEGKTNQMAQDQITGIGQQEQAQMPKLQGYRDQIQTNSAKSLADLSQQLRDGAMSAMNWLGAKGAYGSSGNQGVQYALSKEFGKLRSDSMGQSNQQLADVNMKEQDVHNLAMQQVQSVKQWKDEQLYNIADKFQQEMRNLQGQRADVKRMAADQYSSYLRDVENRAAQYAMGVDSWARERLASLSDMKIQLSQNANYDPQAIVNGEVNMQFNPANPNLDVNSYLNPMLSAKKKDQNTV